LELFSFTNISSWYELKRKRRRRSNCQLEQIVLWDTAMTKSANTFSAGTGISPKAKECCSVI
jgi:hypothetical protein